jgi:hypothetical protein
MIGHSTNPSTMICDVAILFTQNIECWDLVDSASHLNENCDAMLHPEQNSVILYTR